MKWRSQTNDSDKAISFAALARLDRRLFHFAAITVLTVLAYLPSLTGGFVFDDQSLVRDNRYIREFHSLSSYLAQEDGIVGEEDKGELHTGYYRPLINITYSLDFKLWGLEAAGFRLTNLILHLLTCFLLYEVILLLTGPSPWAFWVTLLFSLHPVQTEAVSLIVSRNNILSTMFCLLSLYGYGRWWEKRSAPALALSLTAFAAALFSKEFGLMLLPIFFVWQRFLIRKRNWKKEIITYLPYLVIVAVYLFFRHQAVSSAFTVPEDWLRRLFFAPYLVVYNLKLIFLPYNLHSFQVAYPRELLAAAPLLAILVLLVLATGLYATRKHALLLFCGFGFLLSLLPVLNLITKSSVSLIAMRWLYLPLVFIVIGAAWALGRLPVKRRSLAMALGCVLAAYFAIYSHILNRNLWHDEDTFLQQEVLHFHNPLYVGDYAERLFQKGQFVPAEHYFALTFARDMAKPRDCINYGAFLIETKRPKEAVHILGRAAAMTMIRKDQVDWHNNMGVAMTLIGDYERACEHLKQALRMNGQNPLLHRNMGILRSRQGLVAEAAEHLKITHRLQSNLGPASK